MEYNLEQPYQERISPLSKLFKNRSKAASACCTAVLLLVLFEPCSPTSLIRNSVSRVSRISTRLLTVRRVPKECSKKCSTTSTSLSVVVAASSSDLPSFAACTASVIAFSRSAAVWKSCSPITSKNINLEIARRTRFVVVGGGGGGGVDVVGVSSLIKLPFAAKINESEVVPSVGKTHFSSSSKDLVTEVNSPPPPSPPSSTTTSSISTPSTSRTAL